MFAILLFCQFLVGLTVSNPPGKDSGFLGFKIGMPAAQVLHLAGKDEHSLKRITEHNGQRVLSDTIDVTPCQLPMRRSLGFDSTGKLYAVGFMYKTWSGEIDSARDCAYKWLTSACGLPTAQTMRDSTKQDVWNLGNHTQITLEARAYNQHDFFLLIYYYKDSSLHSKNESLLLSTE